MLFAWLVNYMFFGCELRHFWIYFLTFFLFWLSVKFSVEEKLVSFVVQRVKMSNALFWLPQNKKEKKSLWNIHVHCGFPCQKERKNVFTFREALFCQKWTKENLRKFCKKCWPSNFVMFTRELDRKVLDLSNVNYLTTLDGSSSERRNFNLFSCFKNSLFLKWLVIRNGCPGTVMG